MLFEDMVAEAAPVLASAGPVVMLTVAAVATASRASVRARFMALLSSPQ
ncbi:hypothetical protein ABGB17_02535 [Sphaerisporangium sp. B11E5]